MLADVIDNPKPPRVASEPGLFVAVGEMAGEVLDQMPATAAELGFEYRGSLGFVRIDADRIVPGPHESPPPGRKAIDVAAWVWQNDVLCGMPRDVVGEDLNVALPRVLRGLRPVRQEARVEDAEGAPRVGLYLIVDLRKSSNIDAAVRVLHLTLRHFRRVDITGLYLTGRSADSRDVSRDEEWRVGLRNLLKRTEGSVVVSRAYLLDGMTSRQEWVLTRQDLARLGAQFLLHHGLADYRHTLRNRERSRVLVSQPFNQYLGSFSFRTVSSSIEAVPERVVDALLRKRVVSRREPDITENEKAETLALVEKLSAEFLHEIRQFHRTIPANDVSAPEASGQEQDDVGRLRTRVRAILDDKLQKVSKKAPLQLLPVFLGELRRFARRLRNQALLGERSQERHLVGQRISEQLALLRNADAPETATTAEDKPEAPREVTWLVYPVSQRRQWCAFGFLVAAVLIGWTSSSTWCAWLWKFVQNLGSGSGILAASWFTWSWSLAAVCLAVSFACYDSGRRIFRRQWFDGVSAKLGFGVYVGLVEGERGQNQFAGAFATTVHRVIAGEQSRVPLVTTRVRPPRWRFWLGLFLMLAGTVLIGLSIDFAAPNVPGLWSRISLYATLLVGLSLMIQRAGRLKCDEAFHIVRRSERGEAHERHTRGTDYPLAYFPRTFGLQRLLGITLVAGVVIWALFEWPIQFRDQDWYAAGVRAYWFSRIAKFGLVVFAAGLWCVVRPAERTKRFFKTIDPIVGDLDYVFGRLHVVGSEMAAGMRWLSRWLDGVLVTRPVPRHPDKCSADTSVTTFLDVVASNWAERLAERCESFVVEAAKRSDAWSECVMTELFAGEGQPLDDLERRFVLLQVRRWFERHLTSGNLPTLLRELRPDSDWLGRFFQRWMAPLWPVTDKYVDVDVGMALVDTRLEAASATKDANHGSNWRIYPAVWRLGRDGRPMVVLIRIVQGVRDEHLQDLLHGGNEPEDRDLS